MHKIVTQDASRADRNAAAPISFILDACERAGVPFAPTTLSLYGPDAVLPGAPQYVFWDRETITENTQAVQVDLLRRRGLKRVIDYNSVSIGTTASHLGACGSDRAGWTLVLFEAWLRAVTNAPNDIAAAFAERIDPDLAKALKGDVARLRRRLVGPFGWAGSCRHFLPRIVRRVEPGPVVVDAFALVDLIARDLAAIFSEHALVAVRVVPEETDVSRSVASTVARLEAEARRLQAEEDARRARWARGEFYPGEEREKRSREAARLKELREGRGWDALDRERLEHLVWSEPTSMLKDRYGVSDVAIAKRCRKLGVPKPPRGFWNKVHAGKIPHPNGIPTGF